MKLARLLIALSAIGTIATLPVAHAEDKVDNDFALSVKADAMKVGVAGAILVTLDVKAGYHWNPDYPAVFETVGAPAALSVPKPSLAQLKGDFEAMSPQLVKVAIATLPKAAVRAPITVNAKFSICNERICLLKKATAVVQVTAR